MRLLLAVIFALLTQTACGQIILGSDLTPGDAAPRPDASTARDAGFVDTGPEPDAGPIADAEPGMDTGCDGRFPIAWPFPDTVASYNDKFWTFASTQAPLACNTATPCHGGTQVPFMPLTAAIVADDAMRRLAIQQLWDRIKPTLQLDGTMGSSILIRHKQAVPNGNFAPLYDVSFNPGGQNAFVQGLVTSSQLCP